MLDFFQRMAVAALLIIVATGITIKNGDLNMIKDLIESKDSQSSLLRHLVGKKEKIPIVVNLTANEFSLRPLAPCRCSVIDLKQTLAPFNGPEPPFLPAYRGGKAQLITLPDQISDSAACRLADGTQMFGQLQYKFTDFESRLEITNFPHKGIIWDASINQLSLQAQSNDPIGQHKVLITTYLPSLKEGLQIEIAYQVQPTPDHLVQVDKKQSEPNLGQPRKLGTPGYCTNSPSLLNLFNTAAYAEQKTSHSLSSQTASAGCDGEIMIINRATYAWDYTKLISSDVYGTPSNPEWWKVTFHQPTSIKTILFINRDDGWAISVIATVGNNTDVTLNPVCALLGATPTIMDIGGWYMCLPSMIGTTFGVYQDTTYISFIEAMAYSQEAIQMNAQQVSFIGQSNPLYPVSNAIQNIVSLLVTDTRQKCVAVIPPAGGFATLSIKIKAQVYINGVVLLPGYQMLSSSGWPLHQTNVAIYGKTAGGTQQLCGVLADYYKMYSEAICNIQANEIIIVQQTAANDLRFCGFGALADCNCSQSSFGTLLFTTPPVTPFASASSISVTSSDNVQFIQFNSKAPDTVSSVCGNADGTSKCGTRQFSFKDKLTGIEILQWPYKGYSFDAFTSKLTIDPAQADATSVLTVSLSLLNYPVVVLQQDLTVVVVGGKTTSVEVDEVRTTSKTIICLPSQILDAKINEEAFLNLPPLKTQNSYNITSKQAFATTFEANVLKVLSTSDQDIGKKYLQISLNSPTLNCTFQVQIEFKSNKTDQQMTKIPFAIANTTESEQDVLINAVSSSVDKNNDLLNLEKLTHPAVEISEINVKGLFTMTFSQEIKFSALFNTRRLKSKGGSGKGPSSKSTQSKDDGKEKKVQDIRQKYLLSDKELNITVISGGEVNDSMLAFEWYASDITDKVITVQLIFNNSEYISSELGYPETLKIEFLQESLNVFRSKESDQSIIEPLQTQKRILPVQAKFGTTTDSIDLVGKTVGQAAMSLVIVTVILTLILKGVMDRMWTMVTALQVQTTFTYTKVPMHAYVYVFMQNVQNISSFDYFQSNNLVSAVFTFKKTQSPGFGFLIMGITSSRLILFLGSIFTYQCFLIVLILLWALCFTCPCNKFIKRIQIKLGKILYWNSIFVLFVRFTQDISIGALLSVEDMKFSSVSDCFDSVYTIITLKILFAMAVVSYFFFKKHRNSLNEPWFQKRYGALTDGLRVENQSGREAIPTYISWFINRRIMQGFIVVTLQRFSPWFQLTANMWLQLADICIKIHLRPHSDPLLRNMEIFNDFVGYGLTIMLYFFTDLNQYPESKEVVAWCYNGLTVLMFAVNFCVMVQAVLREIIFKMKICVFQRINRMRLPQQNRSFLKRITRVVGIDDVFYSEQNGNGSIIELAEESERDVNLLRNPENVAPSIPHHGEGRVHPVIQEPVVPLPLAQRRRLIIEDYPQFSNQSQQSSELSDQSQQQSDQCSELRVQSLESREQSVEVTEVEQSKPNQELSQQESKSPQLVDEDEKEQQFDESKIWLTESDFDFESQLKIQADPLEVPPIDETAAIDESCVPPSYSPFGYRHLDHTIINQQLLYQQPMIEQLWQQPNEVLSQSLNQNIGYYQQAYQQTSPFRQSPQDQVMLAQQLKFQQQTKQFQQFYAHTSPYMVQQLQRNQHMAQSQQVQQYKQSNKVVYGGGQNQPRLPRYAQNQPLLPRYAPQGLFHDYRHRYVSQDYRQSYVEQQSAYQQLQALPGRTAFQQVAELAAHRRRTQSQVVLDRYAPIKR